MEQGVRTQNLRNFTVQIRNDKDQIVGTGIAVSTDGKIVTCAHVVDAAGIDPHNANDVELRVYYPQLSGGEEKRRRAKVSTCFTDFDDDLVLLQLCDGYSPLGLENMPVLGTADSSRGDPFNSYGYRRLDIYNAGWSEGIIQGHVECPPSRKLQAEPVQLKSNQINQGMSGAAVLDTERNLVIGVVSEMWFPDKFMKDSDTAWAVDGQVIYKLATLSNLAGLFFQEESLPLQPAPSLKVDIAEALGKVAPKSRFAWHNAPQLLDEWIGRTELLKSLNNDWKNPDKRVTGLVGFGGEGKSSLARKWVDNLLKDPSQQQPDNVFWWGFYENRDTDAFLEAALNFLSGGLIDPRAVPSSSLRAQIIGTMLGAGRYLFVLDGLEVVQHQDGDRYGLLKNNDLRDLLTYFARPDNSAFCLITSRSPLLDLMEYTTYTHRDVERLSQEDGRALLQRLNTKGSDAELNKVVADWDGHALTLSILAAYLTEQYEDNIKHISDIPVPTADEPCYERVHRVLRRYDEHLTKNEREFLKLFSVFRLPVQELAFEEVFEPLLNLLDNNALFKLVSSLANYRLIRHNEREKSYTIHPLIGNYYFSLFTKGDPSQKKAAHKRIKDYYLSIAGNTPQFPTLDDLKPIIEAVHHACHAGEYDDAILVYNDRICQSARSVLMYELGCYEIELAVALEFLPNQDVSQEPLVTRPNRKTWILNRIGFCLKALGRLSEAAIVYQFQDEMRDKAIDKYENFKSVTDYKNLLDLHILLGELDASVEYVRKMLTVVDYSSMDDYFWDQVLSLTSQAWLANLRGELHVATTTFAEAETREQNYDPSMRYLPSSPGIHHADHLRRIGQPDYARKIIEANLQICEQKHWTFLISPCHRILGDLDTNAGKHDSAQVHLEFALKIARSISDREVLIEALLARGSFYAKKRTSNVSQAFADLNEALNYAVEGGYRIYEADIRIALAWAFIASDDKEKAFAEANRAQQMSQKMKYHWGKLDAQEVLGKISNM
jgi:tetratricopeptide (TPR) repeat protein